MELGQKKAEFAARGLNIAGVTYDSVEVLKAFAGRTGISYPLLSDPASKTIRDFGILNESMPKGTPFYGVPYPGTYIVDAKGVVQSKFFEADYKERFSAGNILLHLASAPGPDGWTEAETRQLKLRFKASDASIHGGDVITIRLEVELKPGLHVYAPGVQSSYIPVSWEFAAGPWKAELASWPASKTLNLPAIKETAPVYEGKFSILRDLTFAQERPLFAATGGSGQLSVESTFRYQACDNKECFPPVNVPVKLSFQLRPHDTQRVSPALQRR